MTSDNAWSRRYNPAMPNLKERLRFVPKPLCDLRKLHVADAAERLREHLRVVFVPSEQHCRLAQEMLGIAHARAKLTYSGELPFLRSAYADQLPYPSDSITCLTGLSNVGKSAFERAMCRLLSSPESVSVCNHEPFALEGIWSLEAEERSSLRRLVRKYLKSGEVQSIQSSTELEDHVRRQIYLRGVCLLMLGELQFVAKGNDANITIVNLVMQLARLGPPLSFSANFSLLHKLRRRPEEERRRLFARIREIEPDSRGSTAWKECCVAFCAAAPEFADLLAAQTTTDTLHAYTFGTRGRLAKLLELAYRSARETNGVKVLLAHVDRAYQSVDYLDERVTIRALERQAIEGGPVRDITKHERRDLHNPYAQRTNGTVTVAKQLAVAHAQRVHEAMVQAACTPEEKARIGAKLRASGKGNNVSPIVRKPRPDKESLLAAAQKFRQSATKRSGSK